MIRIVIDTSALVAIFKGEDTADRLAEVVSSVDSIVIPASCLVEAALLQQLGRGLYAWVKERLDDDRFRVGAITEEIALVAAKAAQSYGKGAGHPAQLNFGDCLSYAVARVDNLPLLYVGTDFIHTDVIPALKPE